MSIPKELTTVTSVSKILAAVIFIIFPFAGFYIGQIYEQQFTQYLEDRTSLDQYIVNPSPVKKQDISTANWKTYTYNRDKRLGYSLQYPDNMYIHEVSDFYADISNFRADVFRGDVIPDPKYDKGRFVININEFQFKETSVSQWLDKWQENYRRTGSQPAPPVLLGTVTIDGAQAIKTVNPITTSLGGKVISYYFTREIETTFESGLVFKSNALYQIDFQYGSKMENPKLRTVFDQILSTFHFTQ